MMLLANRQLFNVMTTVWRTKTKQNKQGVLVTTRLIRYRRDVIFRGISCRACSVIDSQ